MKFVTQDDLCAIAIYSTLYRTRLSIRLFGDQMELTHSRVRPNFLLIGYQNGIITRKLDDFVCYAIPISINLTTISYIYMVPASLV